MSGNLSSKVADLSTDVAAVKEAAAGIDEVTAKVNDLQAAHADNASRLDRIEAIVEQGVQTGVNVARTGALGPQVAAGSAIVQEIIDFLHFLFPSGTAGKPTPGVPSHALPPPDAGADRPNPAGG